VTTENSDVVTLPDEVSSGDNPQDEVVDWEKRAKEAEARTERLGIATE